MTRRPLAAPLVAAAVLALALAPARGLGQAPGADDSRPRELLAQVPHDILTLIDNSRYEIEPISPRPLPPVDPAKLKRADSGQPGDTFAKRDAEAAKKDESDPDELIIHLLEGDVRDFKVRRSSIKDVKYWEDRLIEEGRRQVINHNYAKAFEYFLAVQARNPNWRGLRDAVDALLFEEGTWALAGQERDRGLRLLHELYRRRPDYPDLPAKLAEAFAGEIDESLRRGTYAHGRKVLRDLARVAPDGALASEKTTLFRTRARELAARADAATSDAERLDLYTRSLRVWPDQEGTPERFAEAFRRLPTLDVGVVDVPRPVAPWVDCLAAARLNSLLYRPILVDESDEALLGKRPRQLAAMLEMGDLGRRLEVRLRRGVRWNDGSREVSVLDVVRALSDRAQPRSPAYNARWADLLERIEATDVDTISVRLRRTPLSPPWWLIFPVGPAHASWDGRVSTPSGRLPVGDGPYRFESGSNDGLTLRAVEREPAASAPAPSAAPASASEDVEDVPPPKVLRLREVRLPDAVSAMNALDRGEVAMLELVPHDRVSSLQSDDQYRVGRYRLPALHRLAVDGRTPVLKNRLLRRGIAYAIDRPSILEEVLLRRPLDEANRPSDGPFAADSYANAPDVPPLDYNPLIAAMLISGAKTELGTNRIKLTLEYPARPDAQAAVPRIAESLRKAGLEIELIERGETELEQGLRSGRRFDLAYRVSRCEEPLFEVGPMLCPGYDAAPSSQGLASLASPRIMQLLLQLEHAPEFGTARALVTQIDRECRDELPVIPLWQLVDHFAYRTHVTGPPDVADRLYQDLERWEISPWFATDPR